MMDWTDRHCRFFHRQISAQARLYTEMVTTGALIHGDVARHLDFDPREQPVALQLGGSEPDELAHCARLGERWGYAEINLNCGCPSERVQRGSFGACLMAEPRLVADCIKAMRDAVALPVTVKHRIGIDRVEHYGFVRDFVGALADAGCDVFIVHARSAWLKGLSPKQNREVPPLRYESVYRLREDFPAKRFVLNGGLVTMAQIAEQLARVDGVMVGRAAYHDPYLLARVDSELFGMRRAVPARGQIVRSMSDYLAGQPTAGANLRAIVTPMLGLYHGQPFARRWRRLLSDPQLLARHGVAVLQVASDALTEDLGAEVQPRAA
jgi:tRNA-dihydrouridine synthase A